GYFQVVFAALGGGGGAVIGGFTGGTGGAALCTGTGVGVLVAPGCAGAGGMAGAASGGARGALAGGAIGALLDGVVEMANAGKRRAGNRVPNEQVNRLYREYDLNEAGQSWVHRRISKRDYSLEEIEDVIREAAERSKFKRTP